MTGPVGTGAGAETRLAAGGLLADGLPAGADGLPAGGLPAQTRLGAVALRVTDLERAVAFYEEAIGLCVRRREGHELALGVGGEDLLVLTENPVARGAGRHAGLYHVALLYPSRVELARAALRLALARTPIQGASDHGTHEALYLSDPDGNGLELAADRPRERWPDIGDHRLYAGGPAALDLDDLLALVRGERAPHRAAEGLGIGHVHLHVADTASALSFYTELIGFDRVFELGDSAAFVSAGGYHHHLAFNTWRGAGIPPAPADAVGLVWWTIELPREEQVEAVRERLDRGGADYERRGGALLARDPSGNAVLIVSPASRQRIVFDRGGADAGERAPGEMAKV